MNDLLLESGLSDEGLLPLMAEKRMMCITGFPGHTNEDPGWNGIPLIIIDQGSYFKYESGNLMVGKVRPYDTDSADQIAIVGRSVSHPGKLLQVGHSGYDAVELPAMGICLFGVDHPRQIPPH